MISAFFSNLSRKIHLKILWLRYTYPFLWAHKPLCERFQQDTFQVKSIRICRSCCLLYAGILSSALLGYFKLYEIPPGVLFVVTSAVLLLSVPHIYRFYPRPVRDILRFLLGAALASTLLFFFSKALFVGVIGTFLLLVIRAVLQRQRAILKSKACQGCEELSLQGICSGFVLQAERIRRYETKATEYVMSTQYTPQCIRAAQSKQRRSTS